MHTSLLLLVAAVRLFTQRGTPPDSRLHLPFAIPVARHFQTLAMPFSFLSTNGRTHLPTARAEHDTEIQSQYDAQFAAVLRAELRKNHTSTSKGKTSSMQNEKRKLRRVKKVKTKQKPRDEGHN
eukprot:Selendium_serpulae@DN349_c0_g1_i1.p1